VSFYPKLENAEVFDVNISIHTIKSFFSIPNDLKRCCGDRYLPENFLWKDEDSFIEGTKLVT